MLSFLKVTKNERIQHYCSTISARGIGNQGALPWKSRTDMEYFKKITTDTPPLLNLFNIVIMGRKTFESIPKTHRPLAQRLNIVISRNHRERLEKEYKNSIIVCDSFNSAIARMQEIKHYSAWVIGGKSIYNQAFKHPYLYQVYYNMIKPKDGKDDYTCDLYLRLPQMQASVMNICGNVTMCRGYIQDNEIEYCKMLSDILMNGQMKRGRNGDVLTLFSKQIDMDVEHSFPLLTCKKMFWRGIVEELLFFIRGNTNTKLLEDKKINIWRLNTTKSFIEQKNLNYSEGDMGPMYGFQWRHYGSKYTGCTSDYKEKGIDQLQKLIEQIKKIQTVVGIF